MPWLYKPTIECIRWDALCFHKCAAEVSYLPGVVVALGALNWWSLRPGGYHGASPCTLTLWSGTTAPSGVGRTHHFCSRGICACAFPTPHSTKPKQHCTTLYAPNAERQPSAWYLVLLQSLAVLYLTQVATEASKARNNVWRRTSNKEITLTLWSDTPFGGR